MYFKLNVGSIIDCEIKSGGRNNIFKCELLSVNSPDCSHLAILDFPKSKISPRLLAEFVKFVFGKKGCLDFLK